MTTEQQQFFLPKDFDLVTSLESIDHTFRVNTEPASSLSHRTYFDTFDWRVYTSNALLSAKNTSAKQGKPSQLLQWQRRDAHDMLISANLDREPGFVWELPAGALRNKLKPIVAMRRLLPIMQVQSHQHSYALRNQDNKIIVRLCIQGCTAIDPATKQRKHLPQRLSVQALKGYLKPYRLLLKQLKNTLHLQAVAEDPLALALKAFDRRPCDYNSKPDIQISPDMRTDAAMRDIHLRLLDIIETNEAGVLADIDSEFLHDFRVAGRRSRSALSQVKQVFSQRIVDRLRNEFAWLNQVTGPTRDLDVYLLTIPSYQASLPAAVRADLEPLREFLHKQQRTAQQQLVRALRSARYQRFKQTWRKYLESPLPQRSILTNAQRPIGIVASERIWRMFRRTIKEGEAIRADSPAEDLHELRKTCKKLRYLLECFQGLYPGTKVNGLIKAVKGLQNNLGDFQDLHIQITSLQGFSEQMLYHKQAGAKTLMAMGMLVEILERRQQQAREDFANQFSRFATEKNRQLFHQLFGLHNKIAS